MEKIENMDLDLVQFGLWWLRLLGLLPKARKRNFALKFHSLFVFINLLLHAVLNSVKLPTCGGNVNCIIQNLTFSVLFYSTVYCYILMYYDEKQYLNALDKLKSLTVKYHMEADIMKVELLCRKICRIAIIISNIMIFEYMINPLFLYKGCIAKKGKDVTTLTCGLPSPIWLPFIDYTRKPGIIFAYILLFLWTYPYIWNILTIMIFVLNFITYVILHLNGIQRKLIKIREDPKERHDKLRHCIQHHIEILDLFDSISGPLNRLLFLYASVLPIILSMLAFQMIEMLVTDLRERSDLLVYGFVGGSWLMVLSSLSYVGQVLQDESRRIAEIAYDIPWYDEDISFQKTIMQIMVRANKPLVLRTASIGCASLEYFTTVMSKTYSYLAVLYNTVLSTL